MTNLMLSVALASIAVQRLDTAHKQHPADAYDDEHRFAEQANKPTSTTNTKTTDATGVAFHRLPGWPQRDDYPSRQTYRKACATFRKYNK